GGLVPAAVALDAVQAHHPAARPGGVEAAIGPAVAVTRGERLVRHRHVESRSGRPVHDSPASPFRTGNGLRVMIRFACRGCRATGRSGRVRSGWGVLSPPATVSRKETRWKSNPTCSLMVGARKPWSSTGPHWAPR